MRQETMDKAINDRGINYVIDLIINHCSEVEDNSNLAPLERALYKKAKDLLTDVNSKIKDLIE